LWCTPVVPTTQETETGLLEPREFEASIGHIVRSYLKKEKKSKTLARNPLNIGAASADSCHTWLGC
jgi:hypothetical protein